jgi:PAS domain S-box-containing protein
VSPDVYTGAAITVENFVNQTLSAHFNMDRAIELELRRAEHQRRLSEARFHQFFMTLPEYCYIISPSGEIIDVNPAACDALGYRPEELIGKPLAVLYASECLTKVGSVFETWKKTGQVRNEEMVVVTKYGQRRTVLLTAGSVKSPDGTTLDSVSVHVDITDFKKAQEDRFHHAAIVESSDDAIISKTLEGTISSWNLGAQRMFAYSEAEVVGRPITILIPPELHEEENRILQRLKAGERIEHYETIRVAKNGKRIDVSLTILPVRDLRGTIIGASKIARDITERKRAEQALRSSEASFRSVANCAPVMIWMSDTDKHCVYFNEPWLTFTGRPLADELGYGWSHGVHPDDLKMCLDTYVQAFDRREKFVMEYRLRRYDGEYRWIHDIGVPRFNPDQSFAGYIGSCIDVTPSKLMEQQLRTSEERSRRIIRDSPVAMAVSHGLQQTQELLNNKFTEVFGYTEEDVPDIEHWWLLAYPDPQYRAEIKATWQEIVEDATAGHRETSMEAKVCCKNGSTKDIEFHFSCLGDMNLVSFVDLTAQKRADADRTQMMAEIAHLNRVASMGQLVASLAHELGQPLAAILSNAEAAERFANRSEPDLGEVRSALSEIIADDKRARAVVQNLRSIFRKHKITQCELDLTRVVREIGDLIRNEARLQGVQIRMTIPAEPILVLGDEVILQQVLLNLVNNAMDAMRNVESGRKILTLMAIPSADTRCGVIWLEDNGPGVSDENKSKLFSPFFTTKPSGLGLGLSICKTLVDSLGGRITLENRSTSGAAFKVELPLVGLRDRVDLPPLT